MNSKTFITLIIILLAAANVYQYRNPQVVEVPAGQEQIDETAWVQRSVYVSRGILLDSLRNENEELARRVRESRDKIANLTTITGRLNLQVDSLETVNRLPLFPLTSLPIPGGEEALPTSPAGKGLGMRADTSYNFIGTFGDGLFRVDSEVRFHRDYLENNLDLKQLRDIRISVATTMNNDRSRILTYVTSPDFEELEYQTYTEFNRRKRWPWFLIGVGVGVVGIEILN